MMHKCMTTTQTRNKAVALRVVVLNAADMAAPFRAALLCIRCSSLLPLCRVVILLVSPREDLSLFECLERQCFRF